MAVRDIVQAAAGNAGDGAIYVEDVFSTYLYRGNNGLNTITNGIDLAGEGGLLWFKNRSTVDIHALFDSERPLTNYLRTNGTNGESTATTNLVFNGNGFSINNNYSFFNTGSQSYVSWTFRKQPKFFDVVTWTGNGANRTIAHNLGSVPGCIFVKRTDALSDWQVYHRSNTNNQYMVLNTTAAVATDATRWNSTTPTSTVFSIGTSATVNASGGTYVAYVYAHNAGGFGESDDENVISCGTYTGNGLAAGPVINLGYEPQFVMIKRASGLASWNMFDTMRGLPVGDGDTNFLYANQATVEYNSAAAILALSATGFSANGNDLEWNGSGSKYIYIAIRRGPMKVPESGDEVFSATTWAGNGVAGRIITNPKSFVIDGLLVSSLNFAPGNNYFASRLTSYKYLRTPLTAAEASAASIFPSNFITNYQTAFTVGAGSINTDTVNEVAWMFKRAPSFFDEVCYTGTGSARTVAHNLAAVPELIIVKGRSTASAWEVYHVSTGASYFLELNYDTGVQGPYSPGPWNGTTPTSTVFSLPGTGWQTNNSGVTYVAYLFASCPGVSKVGSYTGTGEIQQIDCGFNSGARFLMIKRTDSTGDWYVWDYARGLWGGNDPFLLLNIASNQVTGFDYVDTYSAGFEISSTAPAAINASGGTFIFLAIA